MTLINKLINKRILLWALVLPTVLLANSQSANNNKQSAKHTNALMKNLPMGKLQDNDRQDVVNGYTPVVNPEIPMVVNFAKEKISLDRYDMYERYDRELTSLIYAHGNTLLTLKRANKYFPIIMPILKKNGVPEDFVYLAAIESWLNPRAYSPAGAAGIWQIIPATAKQYGLEVNDEVDERYDPEKATEAACKYLKAAYAKYGGWATVAASYNAGMARISKALESQMVASSFDLYLNEETSRYVFRILAMKNILENPADYGFMLGSNQLYQSLDYTVEKVSGAITSWSQWAKDRGTTYLHLKELNPWIRKDVLTNKRGKTYEVKVPKKNDLYRSKNAQKIYNSKWVSKK